MEKKEKDFIRGKDFVIISVISDVIIGILTLIRSKDYIINSLISGLVYVFLTSRAYSIIAALSFDLSIASCHINENSNFTEETNLVEKRERERRRLAEGGEAFILTIMVVYSAG